MKVHASAATRPGLRRTVNEDAWHADAELGLFLVCDGMGGHAAGDVAARMARQEVARAVGARQASIRDVREGRASPALLAEILTHAMEEACRAIHEAASRDRTRRGMGTTCTAILLAGRRAAVAHVGDSRLYRVRGHEAHRLTHDHTIAEDAVREKICTREVARVHPYANVLTRALGVQAAVRVDTHTIDLAAGDTLVLCTDGLHRCFEGDAVLTGLLAPRAGARATAEDLVAWAEAAGSDDDTSVVLLRTEAEGEADLASHSVVTRAMSALHRAPLFRDLDTAGLSRVLEACTVLEVPEGTPIVREGDRDASLFVVTEGNALVTHQGRPLAELNDGMHFGEIALLTGQPRSATVLSTRPTRLLVLTRPSFERLLEADTALAARLLYQLAHRLAHRLRDTVGGRGAPGAALVSSRVP
ncbi:MAG: protein phosphatase 2C domain-containing protein [Sandaracinaceae bacterium]|nr:protein phosphatase 2C domain-containing protein [Sandaracinaceae bacterium]